MRVIEGEIGVIGDGARSGRRGGRSTLSVLEIGHHHLKRIVLADALRGHLTPGKQARLLLGEGLSRGVITRPFIAAVEVEGRKYKARPPFFGVIGRCLVYCGVLLGLLSRPFLPLALLGCAGVLIYYAKDVFDLKRF